MSSEKVLIVDPPSGWMYGFPKPIPNFDAITHEEDFVQWFRDQGYPEELIKQGMLKHCRYWEHLIEDSSR